MTTAKISLSLTLMAALLGACSSTPKAPPPAPAPMAAAPAPAPMAAPAHPAMPAPAPSSTVATVTLPAYLDPKSDIYSGRSIYFDFDQSAIKSEFTPLVERHGKFLIANPRVAVKVEGNTDERGSAEYNLALGQRRAQAVVDALKVYGVKDTQLEAISWGKEKPRATGHDESAWAQNRRDDLVYPSK